MCNASSRTDDGLVVYELCNKQKRKREEYWYRELCTVYPYGLNDNVKGVGNVSSRTDDGLVVYELCNKQKRKFRNRTTHRKRRKVDSRVVETDVKNRMILYKSPWSMN